MFNIQRLSAVVAAATVSGVLGIIAAVTSAWLAFESDAFAELIRRDRALIESLETIIGGRHANGILVSAGIELRLPEQELRESRWPQYVQDYTSWNKKLGAIGDLANRLMRPEKDEFLAVFERLDRCLLRTADAALTRMYQCYTVERAMCRLSRSTRYEAARWGGRVACADLGAHSFIRWNDAAYRCGNAVLSLLKLAIEAERDRHTFLSPLGRFNTPDRVPVRDALDKANSACEPLGRQQLSSYRSD